MKLSVLDVLPVLSGSTAADAVARAADLARAVDDFGYERIWYAEHHSMGGIASSAPELLISHVAPLTKRIRVGAGGVMLPNHTPLQVVERYQTLEALHPGRIDLGIGRAAGTDQLTASALRSVSGDQVSQLIAELVAFAEGDFPAGHPFGRISVAPEGVQLPPIWMLGSSGGSAHVAGQLGTGYAFASHFSAAPAQPAVDAYRGSFQPSAHFAEPRVILALSVVCAATSEEARELSSSIELQFQRISTGNRGPIPTPAEARIAGWSSDLPIRGPMANLLIVGSPDQVLDQIESQARAVGADEVMMMTIVHDPDARIESYRLIAEAAGVAVG